MIYFFVCNNIKEINIADSIKRSNQNQKMLFKLPLLRVFITIAKDNHLLPMVFTRKLFLKTRKTIIYHIKNRFIISLQSKDVAHCLHVWFSFMNRWTSKNICIYKYKLKIYFGKTTGPIFMFVGFWDLLSVLKYFEFNILDLVKWRFSEQTTGLHMDI